MSEVTKELEGPRSDFSHSLNKEVVVKFREADYHQQLGLEKSCHGRLVGVDRYGLWLEPSALRQEALAKGEAVSHFFIPWDEVLTVIRHQEASLFQSKKEYRGLRPS